MLFAFWRRLRRSATSRVGFQRPSAGRAIPLIAAYLAAIGALHIAAMMAFEGFSLGDAAWLTVTTVTTVGYGDVSASSAAGRISTVVLLYFGGIFALAKGAGDYFDYRASRRLRMIRGEWRWNLQDHILLINAPQIAAQTYFNTLVRQFRLTGWGRERPVMILSEAWPEGLPAALQNLDIVHVHGRGDTADGLESADAARAAAIVVLAETDDPKSDGAAFDVIHRVRELNGDCLVLAECVDDGNRERLRKVGASSVMRPMRGYPEMMVRAVVAPGSEYIIENLFTSLGDECLRYDVAVEGVVWGKLASELIVKGMGTPVAYADAETESIECNPLASEPVNAKALYILVKEGREIPETEVVSLVRAL